MAGGFEADCPECGHHWEGIEASMRIGTASLVSPEDTECSRFCPRCYYRLYYPTAMERRSWKRWYEGFLRQSPIRSGWLVSLLARIDASFESAGWYQQKELDLGEVTCPGCGGVMAQGVASGDRLICPRCGSDTPVLTGFTSLIQLLVDKNGFA